MFFAVLSWIMPAGAYDRVLDPNTGRNIVDPNSFHYLPKTPITFIQFISAYSGGFTNAASMIFMTLVVGGTFGIINELGIPAGTEYLDMITPQYIADLISWGAIGARTTESQVHRELASGLSCPVGFKNGTDGNVKIAIDAVKAAEHEHVFLSVTKGGHSAIVVTGGNEDAHVILRGGKTPNYDEASVEECCKKLEEAGMPASVMIDASHSNSEKKYKKQLDVIENICGQLEKGSRKIMGVMIESNLVEGNQPLEGNPNLTYGQSITDGCIGWEDTVKAIDKLAKAVRARRDWLR
jgi:3-deoxy-7-phosphoheptulonate synthase